MIDQALPVAKQMIEKKSEPWEGASNVKYPLLSIGCLQFNSHMYPEIIKGSNVVKTAVFAEIKDKSNLNVAADMIARHMSFQLLEDIPNWEADLDRLLMLLPLFGHAFVKVCYNPIDDKPAIDLCLPHEIIVNQNIKDLQRAQRITHVVELYPNEIKEKETAGLFLELFKKGDEEKDNAVIYPGDGTNKLFPSQQSEYPDYNNSSDKDRFATFIEQQRYLDLDGDGYKEPYIVTVHESSRKVVRIVANYDSDSFEMDGKKVIKIKRKEIYVDFVFSRPVDGTYYGIGFAHLLYPLNESVNSILNQLIDSGTLANTQGGFIDDRLRWKGGDYNIKNGEWKHVTAPLGTAISQSIVPIPAKEPSSVLYQLLGMLVQAARELSSVSDIMQGQQSGQNVPATTALLLVEQGTKIYSVIQKRLYLSLKKEFSLLADLNKKYIKKPRYFSHMDKTGYIDPRFYKMEAIAIYPVADPNMSSQALRLAKAQAMMALGNDPLLNHSAVIKFYMEAVGIPDINSFIVPPDPKAPPPPDVLKIMAETKLLEMQTNEIMMKHEAEAIKTQISQNQLHVNATQVAAQAASMKMASTIEWIKTQMDLTQVVADQNLKALQHELEVAKAIMDSTANAAQNVEEQGAAAQEPETQMALKDDTGQQNAGAQGQQDQQAQPPDGGAGGSIPDGAPQLPPGASGVPQNSSIPGILQDQILPGDSGSLMEGREKASPQLAEKLINEGL